MILALTTVQSHAQDGIHADDHVRRPIRVTLMSAVVDIPATTTEGTYQQQIDHANAATGTFSQRYWQNTSFAKDATNAPVILHICGEGDCTDGYFLNDSALDWAKELGAHVVYLEHRYYGKSLPFADMSNEHMKYLTLDNVMEDLASFQQWISKQNGWSGKWIVVGGSYSGTISALYRQRHPELVVGALASSAPMVSGVGQDGGSSFDEAQSAPGADNDARSWNYQSCSELGYWVADGERTDANLFEPSADFCTKVFGTAPHFNKDAYNSKYNAPFLSSNGPTNILFSYGTEDVWTKIGLTQSTNSNSRITIATINGAVHHYDLNPASPSDTTDVLAARANFLSFARAWLAQ